jgi:AcrR family transcriptional regulator
MPRRSTDFPALIDSIAADERSQVPKGERTRQLILARAAARASEGGLDSLSLGGLADELGMSKSGLFAHFGSRHELQLATIERAREIFLVEVIEPALELPPGIDRLRALYEGWLSYVERGVFPGGCFFSTVVAEFANRPGVIQDRLAALTEQWLGLLEEAIRAARRKGQLTREVNAKRLAFELFAVGDTATRYHGLFGSMSIASAFSTMREIISRVSPDPRKV